jgi:hypothetical protein
MRGSIAIWHETITEEAEGFEPSAEVHINIWRNKERSKRDHFDLLDIGFRFNELRSLKSLSLSLPFLLPEQHLVSDLFERMRDESTLSAIFNETLSPGELINSGHTFQASSEKRVQFFVAKCPDCEREFREIGTGDDRVSVITLTDAFFSRLRGNVGDHYFRFRIKIPANQTNGFVSTIRPKDGAFLSTISTNEVVEFRLNERRNFSSAIREKLRHPRCALINISAVHYFLIRDMGVEMTQSHTNFNKMRLLEPDMWESYLKDCPGFSPDKMIIYHWSATGDRPVESFTALATFRAYYTGNLLFYAAVIVLLGAMGSAIQGLGAAVLSIIGWPTFGCPNTTACETATWNFEFVLIALAIVMGIVVWRR